MPIYTYQIVCEDGTEGETFQVVRRMSDPPLTHHPETGARVVRVYEAPNIAGKWGESTTKAQMSDKNLERLGFTKYQRAGKGKYERTAGSAGPPKLDIRK